MASMSTWSRTSSTRLMQEAACSSTYSKSRLVSGFVCVALSLVALWPHVASSQSPGTTTQPFQYHSIAWGTPRNQVLQELRTEGFQVRPGATTADSVECTRTESGVPLHLVARFEPSRGLVRIDESFGPVSNPGFLDGLRKGIEGRYGDPAERNAVRATWRRTGHGWISELVMQSDGAAGITLIYTAPRRIGKVHAD